MKGEDKLATESSKAKSEREQVSSEKDSVNDQISFDDDAREAAIDLKREIEPFTCDSPTKTNLKRFVKGGATLPLLNKAKGGVLALANYQIEPNTLLPFARSLPEMIPNRIKKLYLIRNSLDDEQIACVAKGVAKSKGLQQLAVIGNGLGPLSLAALAEQLMPSDGFQNIKKLILKDPQPAVEC